MKKLIFLTVALIAGASLWAAPRPLDTYSTAYTDGTYAIQQIRLDPITHYVISADTELIEAPWNGSAYGSGLYVYDPITRNMTGAALDTGSGIVLTYHSTDDYYTVNIGINSATQTALDGKSTTAQGAKADSAVQPAAMTSALGSYATTAAMTSGLGAKFNTPTGSTSQYLRGDGSVATFPSIPAAQVQSDWNAVSGLGVVLNKPIIPAASTVAVNAPLINAGTTTAANLSISAATTSTAGSMSAADKLKLDGLPVARSFAAPARSVVTSTASTGWQIDSTRDAEASYDIDLSSTASIAGNATVIVYLETANTPSTTPSDWTIVGKVSNGQALSLAITLQSIQTTTVPLVKMIPAGKYVRVRSVITGTATATIAYAQEVKL